MDPFELSLSRHGEDNNSRRATLGKIVLIVLIGAVVLVLAWFALGYVRSQPQRAAQAPAAAASQLAQVPAMASGAVPAEKPGLSYFPQRKKGGEVDLGGQPAATASEKSGATSQGKPTTSASSESSSVPVLTGVWNVLTWIFGAIAGLALTIIVGALLAIAIPALAWGGFSKKKSVPAAFVSVASWYGHGLKRLWTREEIASKTQESPEGWEEPSDEDWEDYYSATLLKPPKRRK